MRRSNPYVSRRPLKMSCASYRTAAFAPSQTQFDSIAHYLSSTEAGTMEHGQLDLHSAHLDRDMKVISATAGAGSTATPIGPDSYPQEVEDLDLEVGQLRLEDVHLLHRIE